MRSYFLKTARIGFSNWNKHDLDLADKLWGDSDVTQFISKNGHYTTQAIESRLKREIKNQMLYNVQYFPIFCLETQDLIGCCGLAPVSNQKNTYELGFHLRKNYWGKGLAYEASQAIIDYSFTKINVDTLKAGHHPLNTNSKSLLLKLGFQYEEDLYYPPTGLDHPSYYLKK